MGPELSNGPPENRGWKGDSCHPDLSHCLFRARPGWTNGRTGTDMGEIFGHGQKASFHWKCGCNSLVGGPTASIATSPRALEVDCLTSFKLLSGPYTNDVNKICWSFNRPRSSLDDTFFYISLCHNVDVWLYPPPPPF